MITIIDLDIGNVGSIKNMLKYLNIESIITRSYKDIDNAKKIILPGVGAFDTAIKNLKKFEILESLNKKAKEDKIPILGICLGMQLLTNFSEEGTQDGLGWIDADTLKFNLDTKKYKIPHMGWNNVKISKNSILSEGFNDETRFYFVHSYYVKVKNEKNSILKSNHSIEFDSGINDDNIYGVQFHPEKSHKYGKLLLKNFSNI